MLLLTMNCLEYCVFSETIILSDSMSSNTKREKDADAASVDRLN